MLVVALGVGCAAATPPSGSVSPTQSVVAPTTENRSQSSIPQSPIPKPMPTEALPPEPITLNLWHNLPPDQTLALAEDMVGFKELAPHVSLVVRQYEQNADLLATLETGNTPVDIVVGNASLAAAMHSREDMAPLDGWFDPAELSAFCVPAVTGISRDGQVWGLPDTAGFTLLLFYNRELVSTPPSNTDEMLHLAESLTRRDQWGLVLNSYDPLWVVPWLAPYGGWLTDDAGNPTLDTPAVVDALTLYLGWHGRLTGVAPPAEYVDARQLFLDGKAAMLIDGDWAIAELKGSDGVNWGVATLPDVGGTRRPAAPLVLGRYWLVGTGLSEAQEGAAAQFLLYATRPERQLAWAERFGVLPTRTSALDTLAASGDTLLSVSARQLEAGHGLVLGADANRIMDAMRQPLRRVLDGDMVPEDAASSMQQAMEGLDPLK
jgi:ABC-type glycerol-3-phosphate transport system substrate-binding protein